MKKAQSSCPLCRQNIEAMKIERVGRATAQVCPACKGVLDVLIEPTVTSKDLDLGETDFGTIPELKLRR